MSKRKRTDREKKELAFFATAMTLCLSGIAVLVVYMFTLGSPVDAFFSVTKESVAEKVAEKHHSTDVEISSGAGHKWGDTMVKMKRNDATYRCYTELPVDRVDEADSLECVLD